MKKEKIYCEGTNTTGYAKGRGCCAVGKYKVDGKFYCKNHMPTGTYDDLHKAYQTLLEENKKLKEELEKNKKFLEYYFKDYKWIPYDGEI